MDANLMSMQELRAAIGPDSNGKLLSPSTLQAWIKSGDCPFAYYVPMDETSVRGKNIIFRNRYKTFMAGLDMSNYETIIQAVLDRIEIGGEETWTGSRHGQA